MKKINLKNQKQKFDKVVPIIEEFVLSLEERSVVWKKWENKDKIKWINKDPQLKLAFETLLKLNDIFGRKLVQKLDRVKDEISK